MHKINIIKFHYIYAFANNNLDLAKLLISHGADSGNFRVQFFDNNGVYQGQFGSQGTVDGQFQNPFALAFNVNLNELYVTDLVRNNI